MLIVYRYGLRLGEAYSGWPIMNKSATILGIAVLAIAGVAAPMPLIVSLQNPARNVTIYPNLLFAVPLMLLGALLLLYGAVAGKEQRREKPGVD
jgi:peptidoglycan/LPS O-acetylase OafA/YrhL